MSRIANHDKVFKFLDSILDSRSEMDVNTLAAILAVITGRKRCETDELAPKFLKALTKYLIEHKELSLRTFVRMSIVKQANAGDEVFYWGNWHKVYPYKIKTKYGERFLEELSDE